MKYKIVFIDIDGTLVDDEKRVSTETINFFKELTKKGIYLVLTSGKPYKSIETFSDKCYAVPYLIGSNGAIVRNFKDNINIFSKGIDKSLCLEILNRIHEANLYTMVTVGGNLIVEEINYGITPKNRCEVIVTPSIQKYILNSNEPILKISVINSDERIVNDFRKTLLTTSGVNILPVEKFKVPKSFWNPVNNNYIVHSVDIMASNVSKKEALKNLCLYLNIDLEDTIGIGDGLNDLEMFQVVGYKVAMANGEEEIKKLADMITLSNNESGVAKALYKIFIEQ